MTLGGPINESNVREAIGEIRATAAGVRSKLAAGVTAPDVARIAADLAQAIDDLARVVSLIEGRGASRLASARDRAPGGRH